MRTVISTCRSLPEVCLESVFTSEFLLFLFSACSDVSGGMVAMIHDNTQLPRIDVAGIELAPRRKHKLGYKKKANYFLSAPYTDCTDEIPLGMKEMFNRYEGADYAYSQTVCFTLCTQAFT
jgi:hypothetical protein